MKPTPATRKSAPELIDFVRALARASVARDIAAAREKESAGADGHLRPLF